MKKILPVVIVVAVVVGVLSFYGGMKYGAGKSPLEGGGGGVLSGGKAGAQGFQNMAPEQRQQRFQSNAGGARGGMRQGGDFTTGEIISKDDKSITVKLRDGGSKIIFYSDSSEISKFDKGTAADLEIGKTVTVSGKANTDGSITAQTIQLRPVMPTPPIAPAK